MQNPSYVSGASTTSLIGETIGVHFACAADRWRDLEALVVRHQNVRWTYGDLKQRSDRLAAGLLSLGLAPGDRIGMWSPNNSEWVVTQFATALAGLILVNINPAYRPVELEHALKKSGCKALISAPGFKTSDYLTMIQDLWPVRLPDLQTVIHLGSEQRNGMLLFDQVMRPYFWLRYALTRSQHKRCSLTEAERKLSGFCQITIFLRRPRAARFLRLDPGEEQFSGGWRACAGVEKHELDQSFKYVGCEIKVKTRILVVPRY